MRIDRTRRIGLAAAMLVGIVASGAMVLTVSARTKSNTKLSPTAKAPAATGQAKLSMKTGSTGKFSVQGKHLRPGSTFDVVVNNRKVGTLSTNKSGSGTARFSTNGKGHHVQPLGFDPQGHHVSVQDDDGDDVLDGDMPDDDNPDSAIACCIAEDDDDEGEVECENTTPEECADEGGTPVGGSAAGCLPNPCGGTPGGDDNGDENDDHNGNQNGDDNDNEQ